MAMQEREWQELTTAANAREMDARKQLASVQGLLTASDEQLTLLRVSSQTTQDELSRQLSTAEDSHRKDSALNQELREQLSSAELFAAQLQEQLVAAQAKATQTLSSRIFALISCGASCVCASKRVQSRPGAGSRRG